MSRDGHNEVLAMEHKPEIIALRETEEEIKILVKNLISFMNLIHLQTTLYEKRISALEKANRRKKIINIISIIRDYSYLIFLAILMILFCKFILHL